MAEMAERDFPSHLNLFFIFEIWILTIGEKYMKKLDLELEDLILIGSIIIFLGISFGLIAGIAFFAFISFIAEPFVWLAIFIIIIAIWVIAKYSRKNNIKWRLI